MNENIIDGAELGFIPHPGGLGCTLFEKMWENQDKIAQVSVCFVSHKISKK